MASFYLRAIFYKVPVIKANGKEKPDIQKLLGAPLSIQFCKKDILSFKSTIHVAKGFNELKALDQADGT